MLALVGCTGKTVPGPPGDGINATNHYFFAIDAGTPHEYGKTAIDGVIACESCHPPAAESFTQFSCLGCHEHEKTLTDRLHQGTADYAYDSAKCLSCHPAGAEVAFHHNGITSGCASCHDVGTVFAALPKAGFTHPAMGGSDCVACHTTATWLGGGKVPAGLSHDPQSDLTVNALLPSYSGTSIASVTPDVQTFPMEMNHATTALVSAAFSSCANCHPNTATGSYFPGNLHSSLANLNLAQPTKCADCHQASPQGFVGPTATMPARSPASGEMKHDAVAWAAGAPGAMLLVGAECGTCHAAPSQTVQGGWAAATKGGTPAKYHAALGATGQPAQCLDCHANSRPTGVLTSTNATLPLNLSFDHQELDALGECATCHAKSAPGFTTWAGGVFHATGSATPSTCLPCHAGERPTSTTGWKSTTYTKSPFDYGTNAKGITHGAGADCVTCHGGPGTGAWGGTQNWVGGTFVHAGSALAANACITCHASQRPDLQPGATAASMATLLGFDHSINGSGDCFGCHQATVTAGKYVNYGAPATGMLPGGDWKDGQEYPGSVLVSSADHFITFNAITLNRSGVNNLVTSMSTAQVTLYNAMLHTSAQLPAELNAGPSNAPDNTKCWHCHTNTNGTVTAYNGGKLHDAFTNYRDTPGGAVAAKPQPTACLDCHVQMRPKGIVEKAASALAPMDHAATFKAAVTIGGKSVTDASQVSCEVCHASPGVTWGDGDFHTNIGAAQPSDCTVCHYPLMADAAKSDVTKATTFAMKHRSTQLTFQNCQTCHAAALGKATTLPQAATLFATGALHGSLTAQPATCNECHAVSSPAGAKASTVQYTFGLGSTASNKPQYMNHAAAVVTGKDCAACHLADAKKTGSAWSTSTALHAKSAPTTCKECHGTTNGNGAVLGTGNNLPSGLSNSTTTTTASNTASTGIPAGTFDQLTHADVNVTGHDCNFCHTQVGPSTAAGVTGKEWAQAKFHVNLQNPNPLVMNGTTGRCSNCHLNVKPGAAYTAQDHSTFTAASGSQDCSSCHSYPGTGTVAAPNWLGAAGVPTYISVGGFTVAQPPATTAVTQTGINNLPHPAVPTGTACTLCHATAAGGKQATGYDHALAPATNCNACHEAGSNLIGLPWNPNAAGAATIAAQCSKGGGDIKDRGGVTRAIGLTFTANNFCSDRATAATITKHFYPVDCSQCHNKPAAGIIKDSTGTTFRTMWAFPHKTGNMTNPSTCVLCHTNGIPN
ncbi:MAG: hypothetical protein K1X89_22390 [Myxococcaceae bacterium]|nr:hypothetical protein [Myxococcaceae bacterium]